MVGQYGHEAHSFSSHPNDEEVYIIISNIEKLLEY